jgi:hypothetical protein
VSLRPIGGIFLRLDSSGNLNVYDATGTVIAKFLGGKLSISGNKGTKVSNAPIVSTTSISPTRVASGNSLQITPQITTTLALFAILGGGAKNNTGGDGGEIAVYRSTGSNNPAGGAALDGSIVTFSAPFSVGTANTGATPTLAFIDTGLTIGQAYTYEVAVAVITGGIMTWGQANIDGFEI